MIHSAIFFLTPSFLISEVIEHFGITKGNSSAMQMALLCHRSGTQIRKQNMGMKLEKIRYNSLFEKKIVYLRCYIQNRDIAIYIYEYEKFE